MPDEPNKKVDEMLRAYAQERRKGPEVQLHPATRNLLQGEVRRVFGVSGTAEPKPWWKRLRAFWPQLTFAGSMCLILSIAILSLREEPRSESPTMREQEVELLKRSDKNVIQEKDLPTKQKVEMEAQDARGVADLTAPPQAAAAPQTAVGVDLLGETFRGISPLIAPTGVPAVAPQESFQERS